MTDERRLEIRRELRPSDPGDIVAMHRELYSREHGMDERFVDGVRSTLERALERGFPAGGAIWIPELAGRFAGSTGLTDEGDGLGRIRWVLLDPALRGRGVGARIVGDAVATARELGFERLELDTFSALRAAARIYRALGFRVVSEELTDKWGPQIVYQHYELEL